jgi:hypothetical protein
MESKSHQTNYIPSIIGWLYPVRHKICISCCLLNVIIMLTVQIGNAYWQLYENVLGGNVFMLLNCKAPCFNRIVCNCTNPIWQGSSPLYPLGVTEYPWGIADMDIVTYLTKSSNCISPLLLILVCHLTWHNLFRVIEVTANKAMTLFIDHCYWLYGVP